MWMEIVLESQAYEEAVFTQSLGARPHGQAAGSLS